MSDAPWYVYVLQCVGGSLYTGVTVDVAARLAQHRSGTGAKYTRAFPPVALRALWQCDDQGVALRAERALKGQRPENKRRIVEGQCSRWEEDWALTAIPSNLWPSWDADAVSLREGCNAYDA